MSERTDDILALKSRCAEGFAALLGERGVAHAESSADPTYGLWSDYSLAYFNPAWVDFANDNEAPAELVSESYLGTSVIGVCIDDLRPFYESLFRRCLEGIEEALEPVRQEYECSSPVQYRRFLMTLYPLGSKQGLLIANARVVERPHSREVSVPQLEEYRGTTGLIRQCVHCRRVENPEAERRSWDWIPEWVRCPPPKTTHCLCPPCSEHYYPRD